MCSVLTQHVVPLGAIDAERTPSTDTYCSVFADPAGKKLAGWGRQLSAAALREVLEIKQREERAVLTVEGVQSVRGSEGAGSTSTGVPRRSRRSSGRP